MSPALAGRQSPRPHAAPCAALLHQRQAEEREPAAAPVQGKALERKDRLQLALSHLNKLKPDEQQVVILPTQIFLEGTDVAKAYRRMPGEYLLDGGVRVAVFERVRPIGAEEIGDFSARLREHYPDRPDIYAPATGN